jgi:hypothetical protein
MKLNKKSNKELKQEYKLKKFKMGVFQVRNTVNGKILIEGSVNLDAIWNRYRLQLNVGSHPNAELQKEWKELGEEKFKFEILGEIEQSDTEQIDYNREVNTLKELFLNELQPFNEKGYNRRNR